MGLATDIEWCDSTLNLQMGCDGCELWNSARGIKRCYAGTLTDRYGGRKGWPKSFGEPKLFVERLAPALRWPDLTGTERPGMPWLDGFPRMIFLDDMGDTFTESLPLDWLAEPMERMANSAHIFMLLTKRANRMRLFSEQHPLPRNVWPGVSVTSQNTASRIEDLLRVRGAGRKWVSAEPLWGPIDFSKVGKLQWDVLRGWKPAHIGWPEGANTDRIELVIIGGESGTDAIPSNLTWHVEIIGQCREADVAVFEKQLGSVLHVDYYEDDDEIREWALNQHHRVLSPGNGGFYEWDHASDGQPRPGSVFELRLPHKGGKMADWPERLRVRGYPKREALLA
jgi:protein gp37